MKIRIVDPKSAPVSLLSPTDPACESVQRYTGNGVVFIGEEGGAAVAVAVLERNGDDGELQNIAVSEPLQGYGLGWRILACVLAHAAEAGLRRVTVGVGNSSIRQLAFFQRNGFRVLGVVPGVFDCGQPPIIENGIICRDLLQLGCEVNRPDHPGGRRESNHRPGHTGRPERILLHARYENSPTAVDTWGSLVRPVRRLGEDFDWYALDRTGYLAVFSTDGEGPIPESMWSHRAEYIATTNACRGLPHNQEIEKKFFGPERHFEGWALATRGLFVFGYRGAHRTNRRPAYGLIARPSRPLPATTLLTGHDLSCLPHLDVDFPGSISIPDQAICT